MTPHLAPPRGAHAVRTIAVAIAALVPFALGGCSMIPYFGHAKDPLQRPAKASENTMRDLKTEAIDALGTDPAEPYWPYRLGQIYFVADSLREAEAFLKGALARDRHYTPALALLSKVYYATGRHADAVQMLEAVRSEPGAFPNGFPPVLAAGLALHYDALDRPDLAAGILSAMPRPDTDDAGSAVLYVTLRGANPDAATDLATELVKRSPRSAVNQNNYGIARLRAGDPKSAEKAFLKAIDIDPQLPGPYYNLAILEKFYLLDDEAAARWFKLYGQRAQDDPDGLADVFRRDGPKPIAERKDAP
jgi:tetratricopeptide (TPR) repeat protein